MNLEEEDGLFLIGPRSKEKNDVDNNRREDIILGLFSENPDVRNSFLNHTFKGKFWLSIQQKFDAAVKEFRKPPKDIVPGTYISSLEKKGGRGSRFDFLAKTNWLDDNSGLKIEFKRGASIMVQPQFLQLYAKRGIVVRDGLTSYPEYLFDTFGSELERISGLPLPDKSDYLKFVFRTNSDSLPLFRELHKAAKAGQRPDLLKLQYKSIDGYLRLVSQISDYADSGSFQKQLAEQIEKLFVSWDTERQKFVVEQFSYDDITPNGTYSLKGGKNGLNTIVFENLAGNRIEALLRWKNNPCVLGPAWQIKLRVNA